MPYFPTSEMAREASPPQFSRRHVTREAHDAAHGRYEAEHGPEARRRNADARQADRNARSAKEQVALLDRRLGKGVGAARERARLEATIAS